MFKKATLLLEIRIILILPKKGLWEPELDFASEFDKKLHRRTEQSRQIGGFDTELALHWEPKAYPFFVQI